MNLLLNLEGRGGTTPQSSRGSPQAPAPVNTNHHIVPVAPLVAFISRPQVDRAMKAYRAIGSFRARKSQQGFSHDLVALDEDDARHRIYSNFGSRHGVPRRFVLIDSLEEITPSDSIAPVVVAHFRDTTISEEE